VALGKEAVTVDGRFFLPSVYVALSKPSARYLALGKETFADRFFAECSSPSVALGKEPVCSSDQISIIRCTIEYIFIMYSFYVINIVTLFYKISQT
jgi:hypothetical protein